MSGNPAAADLDTDIARETAASGLPRFTVRLPVMVVRSIAKAALYSAWYLAFYLLCMFRPFTGLMVLAAIVMVPMSVVVFAHPAAANGMPSWAFVLMAIGLVAWAIGYMIFVDWITPPGAEDPFERYRKRR